MPIVGAGSFFIAKYDKKGTTIMQANPNFYGPKPHVKAFGVTLYQNADAMIAALKGGDIDGVDNVPQTVVASLKRIRTSRSSSGPVRRSATSASTPTPRRRRTASCSIPVCAPPSRMR